jgi:hypothetical protein
VNASPNATRPLAPWETREPGAYVTKRIGDDAVVTLWANEKPNTVRARVEWGDEHLETQTTGHAQAEAIIDQWAAQLAAGHSPSLNTDSP